MLLLAQAGTLPIPAPPTPDSGASVGLWAVYILIGLLVAAVAELWRRRIADERERRKLHEQREAQERAAEEKRLEAARLDAASRAELADALRELREQIRGCPAARSNGSRASAAGGLREVPTS
jgi:type II secretory pathway pseudopilin PulG